MNDLQKADQALQELADYLHSAMKSIKEGTEHEHRSRLKELYDRVTSLRQQLSSRAEHMANETAQGVKGGLYRWWVDVKDVATRAKELVLPAGKVPPPGETLTQQIPRFLEVSYQWPAEIMQSAWNELQSSKSPFAPESMEHWRRLLENTAESLSKAMMLNVSQPSTSTAGARQTIYVNVGTTKETPVTLGYSMFGLVYLAILVQQYAYSRRRMITTRQASPSQQPASQQGINVVFQFIKCSYTHRSTELG